MKKLNNKGFTLVELLAVIIILAIVVGISIPAITNVINDSKNKALGVALDAAEDYLRDQYTLMQLGSADEVFENNVGSFDIINLINTSTADSSKMEMLHAMGFSEKDILILQYRIKTNEEICVRVQKLKQDGKFYNTKYWTPTTHKTGAKWQSKSCS